MVNLAIMEYNLCPCQAQEVRDLYLPQLFKAVKVAKRAPLNSLLVVVLEVVTVTDKVEKQYVRAAQPSTTATESYLPLLRHLQVMKEGNRMDKHKRSPSFLAKQVQQLAQSDRRSRDQRLD